MSVMGGVIQFQNSSFQSNSLSNGARCETNTRNMHDYRFGGAAVGLVSIPSELYPTFRDCTFEENTINEIA